MKKPQFLSEYTWRSAEFPVGSVNVSAKELSARLNLPLLRWEEDGLGEAHGFGCRLPNALVLKVSELNYPATQSVIYIEACALVERGISSSICEILDGLGLSRENLTWTQTEEGLEAAHQIASRMPKSET